MQRQKIIKANFLFIFIYIFVFRINLYSDVPDSSVIRQLEVFSYSLKSYAPCSFDFIQVLPSTGDTIKGTFIYGGKSRFRIILPEEEILFDGKYLWSYSKVTNQTIVEDYDISLFTLFPSAIFTGKWENYEIEKTEEDSLSYVTISPRELSSYRLIILGFSKDQKRLRHIDYLDIDNNHIQFIIDNFRASIDSVEFKYRQKGNEEIIDLRFQ